MAAQQLVDSVSSFLARHSDRRGFLRRSAMVGTALAAAPSAYVLRPNSAYAAVCACSGSSCACGSRCCDGYTEFCCTLTGGANRCPPGSIMAGWWKADGSGFCGPNQPRYYMDCNATCGTCGCGSTGVCGPECGSVRCGCANGSCNNRKSGCTQFRYGQCNQDIPCVGPIICRVVSCRTPWSFDSSCTTAVATDNNTRFHDAPCLHTKAVPALATFRDGNWKLRYPISSGQPIQEFVYGQVGDTPLTGNWDGIGSFGIGVRRGSTFILRDTPSAGAPTRIFDWGQPTDAVFTGDWNGNGTTGVGLRRGSTWYLKNRLDSSTYEIRFNWGRPDDIPIVGDWNGDGRTGVGLLRGQTWYLKNTLDASPHDIQFTWNPEPSSFLGLPGPAINGRPVCVDWNGNGTTGIGIVDGTTWYMKNSFDGAQNERRLDFGQAGDIPLAWGIEP